MRILSHDVGSEETPHSTLKVTTERNKNEYVITLRVSVTKYQTHYLHHEWQWQTLAFTSFSKAIDALFINSGHQQNDSTRGSYIPTQCWHDSRWSWTECFFSFWCETLPQVLWPFQKAFHQQEWKRHVVELLVHPSLGRPLLADTRYCLVDLCLFGAHYTLQYPSSHICVYKIHLTHRKEDHLALLHISESTNRNKITIMWITPTK